MILLARPVCFSSLQLWTWNQATNQHCHSTRLQSTKKCIKAHGHGKPKSHTGYIGHITYDAPSQFNKVQVYSSPLILCMHTFIHQFMHYVAPHSTFTQKVHFVWTCIPMLNMQLQETKSSKKWEDVGKKKAQKQDIIRNGRIILNSIPIPTFHLW